MALRMLSFEVRPVNICFTVTPGSDAVLYQHLLASSGFQTVVLQTLCYVCGCETCANHECHVYRSLEHNQPCVAYTLCHCWHSPGTNKQTLSQSLPGCLLCCVDAPLPCPFAHSAFLTSHFLTQCVLVTPHSFTVCMCSPSCKA
jgi:hypothetical protein